MGLKEIGASLPPGFRFYPSDEELVCHYLYKKIVNEESINGTLVDIDLHSCEPWQLPEVAKLSANEWYFFTFRDRKYATGFRTNRATTSGYWKATGKDRPIFDPKTREIVGMRKTLVFYRNRAPNGIKTGWIMHEFRLECPPMPPKEDWVLCRVFHKNNRDTNITNMLDQTGIGTSSMLQISLHENESPLPMPTLSNEDHLGVCQQPPNANANYSSISSSNNNNHNCNPTPSSTLNNNSNIGTTTHNDLTNSYVIVPRNNNQDDHTNLNDNMSSSSSRNPNNDHHHVGSSFSFSELMNENEEDDYGFLGDMGLLEGTSKFGGGVGFEEDNGSLSSFF